MTTAVTPLARTLDQELLALSRGASLECLTCGEFVMRLRGVLACPECRSLLADGSEVPEVVLPRVSAASSRWTSTAPILASLDARYRPASASAQATSPIKATRLCCTPSSSSITPASVFASRAAPSATLSSSNAPTASICG